ncbi:aminoacyl-tRNA hydrolase [Spongiibacter sp. KMU-158]|uniref:Aminoacyl-tRNA hydrolase n=1 Tax=Spongiibacter pelagi TaxID=2760804 RepID=A0A927C1X5_9GAMM|nr:alternative ribosome rescue aminoacyl-tRNA hydrolase ArfB [Spongiibacter pelagi]MBD2858146.1 aminoacyl-tRNA hydrolase [Spongiibacter pelagi]
MPDLIINSRLSLPEEEIQLSAIRAQGSGGQNVNKVSSAIHLRFDINNSSLPDFYKERLLETKDQRITKDGIIIIKAQQFRTQEKNREDALERLAELIRKAGVVQKTRYATKPSKSARTKRTDAKTHRGRIKSLRGNISTRGE